MKTKKLLIVSLMTAGLIFFSGMSQSLFSQSLDQFNNSVQTIDDSKPELRMYNSPDPFISSTNIMCYIPFPGVYTLYVYERSTGNAILLFEGPQKAGYLQVRFSPDGPKPDVYDAELTTLQASVKDVMVKEAESSRID